MLMAKIQLKNIWRGAGKREGRQKLLRRDPETPSRSRCQWNTATCLMPK
ncbi:uncharacterized protein METZ01_LOCUS127861 [marine metagenome]|uniref:Uncharacterized protein n=1 Tax=marine metagenome TaxID=408172 RepID=A0A381YF01_9ZZZZ